MTVTAIESQATTRLFYTPVEAIEDSKLLPPSAEHVGNKRFQNLLKQRLPAEYDPWLRTPDEPAA